jgi:hypothetical protein
MESEQGDSDEDRKSTTSADTITVVHDSSKCLIQFRELPVEVVVCASHLNLLTCPNSGSAAKDCPSVDGEWDSPTAPIVPSIQEPAVPLMTLYPISTVQTQDHLSPRGFPAPGEPERELALTQRAHRLSEREIELTVSAQSVQFKAVLFAI